MALTKTNNRMIDNASFNVKDYGATGDGTTGDSTAISAAITAASAGDTIFFPTADYVLDAAVVVGKRLLLIGYGATLKIKDDYRDALSLNADKTVVQGLTFEPIEARDRQAACIDIEADHCKIQDCDFLGNGKVVGQYGRGLGISFGTGTTDPNHLVVENCTFKDFEFCVQGATSKNLVVKDCYFTGGIDPTYAAANYGSSSLGDGLKLSLDADDPDDIGDTSYTGFKGAIISGCVFEDMERDAMDFYYRGSHVTATNNIFRGNVNKCFDIKVIYDTTQTSISDVRQARCFTISANQFVDLAPTNYVIDVISTETSGTLTEDNTAQAVVIDSNVFDNVTANILNIDDSSFVSFTNNIVRKYDAASNDEYVITFTGSESDAMRQFNFSGNQIRIFDDAVDLGFIKAPSGVGDIEHVTISNNTYYGGEDDVAINFENDSNTNFVICNNIIQGNIDTSGTFGSTHIAIKDLTNAIISNNMLQWGNLEGIRLDGAYNVRIMNNVIGNMGQTATRKEIRIEDGTNVATSNHVYIKFNTLHDNGSTTEGVLNNGGGGDIVVSDNDTF